MIFKMLKELYRENIEEVLKLIWCICTNITNKGFLNISKLISIIKGGLKKELDLF